MKKLRKTLLILAATLLLLLLSASAVLLFFAAHLREFAVKEINRHLTARVSVQQIETEVWSSFPQVSLVFTGVGISNPAGMQAGNLLQLDKLALCFDAWEMLSGCYRIASLQMEGGTVNLLADTKNRYNFDIWKTDSTADESDFAVDMNKITALNLVLNYAYQPGDFATRMLVKQAKLNGRFSSSQYSLSLDGDFVIQHSRLKQTLLAKQLPMKLKTMLAVDNKAKTYTLNQARLWLNNLQFETTGSITAKNNGYWLEAAMNGKKMDVAGLLGLVPAWGTLAGYQSKGQVYFKAQARGPITETAMPAIQAEFGVEKGWLQKNGSSLPLENLNMQGSLSMPDAARSASGSLTITKLSGRVKGSRFSGNLHLQNLADPELTLHLNSRFSLTDVFGFAASEQVKSASGKGQFSLKMACKTSWLNHPAQYHKMKAEGRAVVQQARITTHGGTAIDSLQLDVVFNPRHMEVNQCSGWLAGSDFSLTGKATGWQSWLLTGDTLKVAAKLHSHRLDLTPTNTAADTTSSLPGWPPTLHLMASVSAHRLLAGTFEAEQVHGQLTGDAAGMQLTKMAMKTCNGRFELNHLTLIPQAAGYRLTADASLQGIDVSRLFAAFGNFGQKTLTQQHLRGILDARQVQLYALLNTRRTIQPETLKLTTDIEIQGGELIGFEPALALSRFADVNDLQHLRFDNMSNSIRIENSTVHIPRMSIRNNALNLTMQGTHSFDNLADYHIELKLKELILKKRRQRSEDAFGQYEDEEKKEKGLTLYIAMKGRPGTMKVSYDRKPAGRQAARNLQEEKKTMRQLFNRDFGTLKDRKLNPQDSNPTDEKIEWDE